MFAIIVLSHQRKFLSRKVCQTPVEAGQFVCDLLQKDVVGSVSIQRMKPKVEKELPPSP